MSLEFTFTSEYKPTQIDQIVGYLEGPRLWIKKTHYPDYFDWLNKVHSELKGETKRAIIALDHKEIIVAIIYQRHKALKNTLELKNLTVRPDLRGRYIASFLIRNAEVEGEREFKCDQIVCDAKASNFTIRAFLFRHDYKIWDRLDLYHLKAGDDIVYHKKMVPVLSTAL